MKVDGVPHRTIWLAEGQGSGADVQVIDQTQLPHAFVVVALRSVEEAAHAVRSMQVRGAPLIGATAAYGMALAVREDPSDRGLESASTLLLGTRPTAVNLRWAIQRALGVLRPLAVDERVEAAYDLAASVCEEDVEICRRIGVHGMPLLRAVAERKGGAPVNVLTHCNAGWLATVDWGTATAPIYQAHDAGIPVHVWVDETRPRNQGASLTAWELGQHGVPHTVIVDNAGGHLMQHGRVDLCIVGTDRTTATGDVCNKIGTYLKALAAHDNGVPFHVALPSPTIDWTLSDGVQDIPIEERDAAEVTHVTGRTATGRVETVAVVPRGTPAANFAFDVTPARYVTSLLTERGVAAASAEGLRALFPDRAQAAAEVRP